MRDRVLGCRSIARENLSLEGKLGRQPAFDSRRRHSGESYGAVEGYPQASHNRQQAGDDRQQAQHQLGQAGRGLMLPALVDGQEADDQEVTWAVSACNQRAGAALVAPARTFGRSRTGRSLRDSPRARLERGTTSCQYLIPCRPAKAGSGRENRIAQICPAGWRRKAASRLSRWWSAESELSQRRVTTSMQPGLRC
jgi:hypothetical protein